MSLFEEALKKVNAKQLMDDTADGWFDRLTEELDQMVLSSDNDVVKTEGSKAVEILKNHKSKLLSMGKKSLTLFVSHVATGNLNSASDEYYRTKASADEIISGILSDAKELHKTHEEIKAMKAEALEIAKSLLSTAKTLLPLMLGML